MRPRFTERLPMSHHHEDGDPAALPLGLAAGHLRNGGGSPAKPTPALRSPGASAMAAARSAILRENIERLIQESQLKPAQLARMLGLTNGNLFYNFRNGHSESLSADTLVRICSAFPGLTLDELVGRTPWRGLTGRSPAPHDQPDQETPGQAARPAGSAAGGRRKQRQAALQQAARTAVNRLTASLAALRGAASDVERDADEVKRAVEALLTGS